MKLNSTEELLKEDIIEIIGQGMHPELADLKATQIIKLFYAYTPVNSHYPDELHTQVGKEAFNVLESDYSLEHPQG